MFIRSAFNYDRDCASFESGVLFDRDLGRTQQQFRDEVEINTIVKRFGVTGKVPVGLRMPDSGDFSSATDYHSAMNILVAAKQQFMTVPADIRRRFYEDPDRFAAWLHDPASREEATKLGFFKQSDVPRSEDPAAKPPANL